MPDLATVLGAVALLLSVACRSTPEEPSAPHGDSAVAPRRAELHRIVAADHRHVVHLAVGDRIALPDEPAFHWRFDLEDRSAFADAGADVYALTKPGPYRVMVYGDPKCMKTDAGCGLSKRRWDVTFEVSGSAR